MDDKKNEQIIVSDFDNDFWYELFDLQVMQIRAKIAEFDGIKIIIRTDEKKGHIPHLHAEYGEYEVSVKTNGELLRGKKFPHKKAKVLKKWVLSEEGQRKIIEKWNEYHKDGIASFTLALGVYEKLMPKKQ